MSASPPSMSTALLLSECMSSTAVLPARSIRDMSAVGGLLCACSVALCGGLMLWCFRCVLTFKLGFWVCASGGVRDVHVLICTCVVQIRVDVIASMDAVKSTGRRSVPDAYRLQLTVHAYQYDQAVCTYVQQYYRVHIPGIQVDSNHQVENTPLK